MPARFYVSLNPLVTPFHMPRPVDWSAEFGRAAPIELEIGSGNGEYLVRLAQAHPERDFVGIELRWGRVKKTLRKIGLAGVPNARILYAEVHLALERLFPPGCLARVHTLFPCPWPGDEEGRHRVYRHDFLRLLNSRLAPDGTAFVVTDDRDYFDWVLAQVPGTGFAASAGSVGPDYGTKFEHKWRAEGQSEFHRLDLAKLAHADVPLREEDPVRLHWIERFDPAAFHPRDTDGGDALVRFKGLVYDPARTSGLVRVVVVEDRLKQEFWIEVWPEARGWRIAPARGCHVILTDGVQCALDAVWRAAGGEPDAERGAGDG